MLAKKTLEAAREDNQSLTVALLDLDRFKRINDQYGHLTGDRAIRHVVGSMREILRDRERLVRIGGQEFVLLMYCPIGNAWERLDRLHAAEAAHPRQHAQRPGRGVVAGDGEIFGRVQGADLRQVVHRKVARPAVHAAEAARRLEAGQPQPLGHMLRVVPVVELLLERRRRLHRHEQQPLALGHPPLPQSTSVSSRP